MAKLPDDGYVIHVENEEYRVSDDFAECLICLLKYGDTSNADPLSKIYRLTNENKRLKEELDFVRGDNTKFEEDLKQVANEKRRLEAELEESQRNNMELAAENQRLIQTILELDSQVNTLKKSRDGYRDCLQQKLQEENDKLRQDNKEISDDIKKLRTQCSTLVGQRNKYYELYKQLMVENRRLHRGFAVLDLDNFIKEGVRERCFKLQAENEELKTQSSSLQKENVRLVEERENLQKKNEYLSGSIEKICDIHAKEKAELKEQLETSSDLTMASELANIFAEYTVADRKNRDDLGDKITEFRRKYGLE